MSRIDEDGDELWTQLYETSGSDHIGQISLGHDNSLIMVGTRGESILGGYDLFFNKLDPAGNVIWSRIMGGIGSDGGRSAYPTSNGGYVLHGNIGSFNISPGGQLFNVLNAYLFQTDSLGQVTTSKVAGNIFDDFDLDCEYNGEEPKPNWLVEATAEEEVYYAISDSAGWYCLPLDTGNYQLRLIPASPYWEPCEDSIDIDLEPYDSLTVHFPLQPTVDCPYLVVDISTPFLRRCFDNVYTVSYCNQGTAPATDAYVEITLDPFLNYLSSSIPFSDQQGELYTFSLGDLEPGACGTFAIEVNVSCDAEIGQTHCAEAHIYPDTLCIESPDWSGASIELDASCSGDSIIFTIQNVGNAPTSEDLNFLVIEDQVILLQGGFDLEPGESIMIGVEATGSTFRMEAQQEPNHPGNSLPSIWVEGCGDASQPFSLGYVLQFPENDGDPFVSIDCQENIGSWDPNDKQATPKGYGEENFIEPGTELEYKIRFQNTGTDTAFNVVIRDPLSPLLDITTVRPGASSHPYRFEIGEDRNLIFYFDDIMLPDSNVNEPASHGFVKFKVQQMPDNPLGPKIENYALIFFDFNQPVITNRVVHTLGIDFVEIMLIELPQSLLSAKLYPNPFEESATIEVKGLEEGLIDFQLFDVSGRLVRKTRHQGPVFQFHRQELSRGFYFYKILSGDRVINSGKVIIQ